MTSLKALFFMLLSAVASLAWADSREELHAGYAKLLAAKSFRATVTDVKKGQQISRMEFVAPDRYHMTTSQNTEQTIIGDDAWMNVDGRTLKLPVPVGKIIAQYRNESALQELSRNIEVTSLGDDIIDGETTKIYRYSVSHPIKANVKAWVSQQSGRILQIESQGSFTGIKSTTRVRYTDFDDPTIKITLPKGN